MSKSKKIAFDFSKENNHYDMLAKAYLQNDFIVNKLFNLLKSDKSKITNTLGKIMIYENIITYRICYLIRARQNEINFSIKNNRLKIKEDNPQNLLREDLTFGSLIKIIEYLFKNNLLIGKLKNFNIARNKLTHFMHLDFYSTKNLFEESKRLCLLAEDILLEIKKEDDIIGKEILKNVKISTVLNAEEFVAMERDKENAIFKNPEDVNNNLKIIKKIKNKYE